MFMISDVIVVVLMIWDWISCDVGDFVLDFL